jgi:hypothetical protein
LIYFGRLSRFVLKPELRDPIITSGTERILREAHQEVLFILAALDYRLTDFLKKHTRHMEPLEAGDIQRIKLDWESPALESATR